MIAWPAAPYVAWARTRPTPRYDLAASDLLPVTVDEWPAMGAPVDGSPGDDGDLDAALCAAIAAHVGVPADHVVTAVGSSGANVLALAALLRPGDAVVVEDPGYAPLAVAARSFGAAVIAVPRDPAQGCAIDPDVLAAAITPRTRLILLTRPHNPTGAPLDTPRLQAIADIAERAPIHVLVDEVYLDTLGSASRGVAIRMRAARTDNRVRLQRAFAGRDDLAWVPRAGGTVAFPRLLRVRDVDAFVDRLLVDHHTAVVPGRFFGHPQHVRVAFGMSAGELAAGLDGLTAALDAAAHLEGAI
jgi:aspartate/methionine/tyrosine aminotransferase